MLKGTKGLHKPCSVLCPKPVAPPDPPLGVECVGGEQAGAVGVEEGRERVAGELVDQGGEAARDVAVADVLAHHAGVLALDEGVVVAAASNSKLRMAGCGRDPAVRPGRWPGGVVMAHGRLRRPAHGLPPRRDPPGPGCPVSPLLLIWQRDSTNNDGQCRMSGRSGLGILVRGSHFSRAATRIPECGSTWRWRLPRQVDARPVHSSSEGGDR